MKMSTLFFEAADLLEKDGWCRDALITVEGKRCAMGALGQIEVPDKDGAIYNEIIPRALKVGREKLGVSISEWNDDVAKDQSVVIRVLREIGTEQAVLGN